MADEKSGSSEPARAFQPQPEPSRPPSPTAMADEKSGSSEPAGAFQPQPEPSRPPSPTAMADEKSGSSEPARAFQPQPEPSRPPRPTAMADEKSGSSEPERAFVLKVPKYCPCDGCWNKMNSAAKDLMFRCECIQSLDQSALSTKGELKVVATADPEGLRRRLRKVTGKMFDLVIPEQPPGKGVVTPIGDDETTDDQAKTLLDEVVIPIEDDERTKDQAKRKEKNEQQRKGYMKWRLCFSFFGHCFLFALSFIPGLGEETSGQKWLRWGMMDVIVPSALLIVMIIIQIFYIDLEDISSDKKTVKRCKIVNLATISCSKIVYFAISQAPAGANVTVRGIAHAVAFLIDMVGAIYLYRNHSCYELDNI